MALEATVSHDISCLYAAKNFSEFVVLTEPELPKGVAAIQKLQEMLVAKINEANEKLVPLMELEEENPRECEKMLKQIIKVTHKSILSEAQASYKLFESSGSLNKYDEEEFKKFLGGFNRENVRMLLSASLTNLDDCENDDREMDEFIKKSENAFANYLASAGINTPEGNAAWDIANWAGMHFDGVVGEVLFYNQKLQRMVDSATIKLSKTDLEEQIEFAIVNGIQSAQNRALIGDKERLKKTATQWLSKEINARLSIGLEFNLLDYVSVWNGENKFVYLKHDRRIPYQI